MSKAAKQSIFLLAFLLIGALSLAGYFAFRAQNLQNDNNTLKRQKEEAVSAEKRKTKEIEKLNSDIKKMRKEKLSLAGKLKSARIEVENLSEQFDSISKEKDTFSVKLDNIKKERDELVSKIQALQKQTVQVPSGQGMQTSSMASNGESAVGNITVDKATIGNDEYWAKILRDKASLQIQLDSLKKQLSQNEINMVELKQSNADLKIDLDSLKHSKEEVAREMQHKEDLINNLALELARTKNDKKFTSDRLVQLNNKNTNLRRQIKELFTTKSGLEKTIVMLEQKNKAFEKRMQQTDSLIQSKIDEIWEIKDSLDKAFQSTSLKPSSTNGGVELPPIAVTTTSGIQQRQIQPIESKQESDELPGFNGKVVSVNEDNNFVIVDLGEKSGLRIGDVLSVYRDSKYIARLKVIQVRKEISAADIKDQWSKIAIGDIVK